jgi:inorganic phosphate transporter, PiT family
VRGLLILTCTSVSFSHGINDGQKSIGLITLTIIGLMPVAFALNPEAADQTAAATQQVNSRARSILV